MTLKVQDLTCYRGSRLIFRGITFDIGAGEIVMLRGPNGAGKSTLLRALAGLLPVDGRVELNGHHLSQDPDGVQEQIAFAGHLDAIKPQLTVEENLTFWAELFGGGDLGAARESFNLTEIWERPAHACSAGQKRRLGLARLMVSGRPLWLLDEPTVSLDVETTARFADILKHHAAAGGMALVATHIDLGLENPREIRIDPLDHRIHEEADHRDPFLSGDWA